MENSKKPIFTLHHLLYFIFLSVIMTTDAGFDAPLLLKMGEVFGVNQLSIAFLISIMAIAGAVFLPLWGAIADKVNRVRLIFLMILSGSIVSLLTVFTISLRTEFWLFGLMRFLAVVINTALGPAVFTLLVDFVPSKDRGGVMGWMGIAGTAAIGLGMTVSGIIPSLIYGSNFPLEFPYLFDFFAGLFYCGLTLTLKEPERGAQDEGLEELRKRGETYDYTLTLDGTLDFFRRPINLKLFSFYFLLIIVNSTLGKLFILFLNVQHGVQTGLATLMMFSIFGIQLVGQIYWGNVADRKFRETKDGRLKVMIKILGIGMCFIIPAFLIPFTFNYPAGVILFYIFAIVLATGSFFIIGTHPNTGVIVADVNFPEVRATTNSIMLLANTAATAIFIPIFTILALYTPLNYSGTYFLFMLICFPSAFLFLLSMRKSIIPNIERIQEELKRRVEKE